jgi:hypothetical protein
MIAQQKTYLILVASAVVAYGAGTYTLELCGPLAALDAPGTASKMLEFGGRTRTYLVHSPEGSPIGGRAHLQIQQLSCELNILRTPTAHPDCTA